MTTNGTQPPLQARGRWGRHSRDERLVPALRDRRLAGRAARPGGELPLAGSRERRLVLSGARHAAPGPALRQAARNAPAPGDGRCLRAGRRHLPLPANRRERALPGLRPRQLLHVALRRGDLPAREPPAARRVRRRAPLLPGARHSRLRHGLGGKLRRRRLQHRPPRHGAGGLHRSPLRAVCGRAGGGTGS